MGHGHTHGLGLSLGIILDTDAFQDPREKSGKAELRLSLDEDVAKMNLGGDNGAAWGWAFYHARRVAHPGAYTFESMRYPGAFLCTADMVNNYMKPADHGSVKLVMVSERASESCVRGEKKGATKRPKDPHTHPHLHAHTNPGNPGWVERERERESRAEKKKKKLLGLWATVWGCMGIEWAGHIFQKNKHGM